MYLCLWDNPSFHPTWVVRCPLLPCRNLPWAPCLSQNFSFLFVAWPCSQRIHLFYAVIEMTLGISVGRDSIIVQVMNIGIVGNVSLGIGSSGLLISSALD